MTSVDKSTLGRPFPMRVAKPAHRYSILYVERDLAAFSSIARRLTKNGFILHVAENGHEGVRLFAEVQPDIVITEINLPGMDGLEMVRQLRYYNPRLQVIILSSQPECEQLIEAINLGVNFFLRKPVNEVQLHATLNKALHNIRYVPAMFAADREEGDRGVEPERVQPLCGTEVLPSANSDEIHRINAELEYRLLRRNALLEAANTELEDFCDAISHDLRGPLSRLQGFSHVLFEDYGDQLDSQGKLYLERIDRTSRQLKTILDALLDLSMLTRKSLVTREVDLSGIASDVVNQLKNTASHRNVASIIAPGISLNGDAGLLRIALENLLGNADMGGIRRRERGNFLLYPLVHGG